MTPPTLQKFYRYSCHPLYNLPIASLTFLCRCLLRMAIILSTKSSLISTCLLLISDNALMLSTYKVACPLPLNSSSILNTHVLTYRLLAISLANYSINSCSSYISIALIGVGTSASAKIFLAPDFVE